MSHKMKSEDLDLFGRLESVQRAYEESLKLGDLAGAVAALSALDEPVRNVFYPLDLAVDKDAVHALVV